MTQKQHAANHLYSIIHRAKSACTLSFVNKRCQPAATPAAVGSLYFSTTEASGSSQNAQTTEPTTSRPAATMNGAGQEPNWAKTPKTKGESAPPMFPAMFIIPDTVPEYLPPTSMGTAQDGPMGHSRKNMAAVKQYTAV